MIRTVLTPRAFVLLLAILLGTVCAFGVVPVHAQETGTYTLTPSPTTLTVGESLTVSWDTPAGVSRQSDWIGLFKEGAGNSSYLAYKYTGGEETGSITFTPNEPGEYVLRYFKNNGYTPSVESVPVTVTETTGGGGGGGTGGGTYTLTPSPTTLTVGESLTVSWDTPAGVSRQSDWIGLFKEGAGNSSYLAYKYTGGEETGSITFTPNEPGEYVLRYFKNNGYTPSVESVPVTVTETTGGGGGGGTGGGTYTLTVTPQAIIEGENVLVSWTVRNAIISPLDYVALYEAGSQGTILSRKFTFIRGGETFFRIDEPGIYEFRYITGLNGQMVAISSPFVVGDIISNVNLITNYPPGGTSIVALGDSLTQGVGASAGKDYVSMLSSQLELSVVNAGVSGNTTADALARLNTDVLSRNPDIVIILLGGNDLLQFIPTDTSFASLRTIVERIQAQGGITVIVGVQGGVFSDRFADSYRTLAAETGSVYIPHILRGIIGNPKLLSDPVHPNDAGYALITDRIAPVIEQLLGR